MKKLLIMLSVILIFTSVLVFAEAPDENYTLLFNDEFEKEIDLDTWYYRTGERLGGYNYPENVYVKDGRMYHVMRYEKKNGEEQLTGGGIISNELFGYGYYETKSTLIGTTGGMHASFWSMGLSGDGEKMPKRNQIYEIDGYEINSHQKSKITCNLNLYVGGHKGFGGNPSNDLPTDEEFILGYEWLPNEINWYLNGKLIQTKKGEEIPIHYAQQNIWVTGLANTSHENTIDRSKLPAEASWDYVKFYAMPLKNINIIGASEFEYNKNPGFTTNIDVQYPMSWLELGDSDASLIEKSEHATSGNNVLAHRSSKNYAVTTAQRLYYIANGNYNFEVYAMSSGGQDTAKIRISGFDGDKVIEKDIPKSDKMEKITIEGIEIKDNGAYIEFISDASKNEWLIFDDPSLYCTHGKEVEKALPFVIDLGASVLGEHAVSNSDEEFSSEGEWQASGVSGYNGKKSVFVYQGSDASAEFVLTAPNSGTFDIGFYKVAHSNSAKKAHVYFDYKGKITEKSVDLTKDGGWEILGTLTLKKGEKVTVGITSKNGGLLRASAAALLEENSITLKDVIILKPGNHRAYTSGKKLPIDENNYNIVPKIVNSRTMVPIRFIAEALGAKVSYVDETREIVIDMNGNKVILKVDSSLMKVNEKEVTLDAPAYLEDGRTLVPIRAISEGLGKKVSYLKSGFVIVGDKEFKETDELSAYMKELY